VYVCPIVSLIGKTPWTPWTATKKTRGLPLYTKTESPGEQFMSPLNPSLYNALVRRFGHVVITNSGEPARVSYAPDWSRKPPRLSAKIDGGEHYYVNCPFCHDIRRRLSFSHLWGTIDERTGQMLSHLVCCFNENCIADRLRQKRLYSMLFPLGRRLQRLATNGAQPSPANNTPVPTATITLPANCTPLRDLPAGHPARVYLEQRGFDIDELSTCWHVCYCEGDESAKPKFWKRIIIPLYDSNATGSAKGACPPDGRLMGWQARAIRPVTTTKYLTSAGTRKSCLLYGLTKVTDGTGPIVLAEGPTDVWRLGHDAVAILGKKPSPQQRQLLLEIAEGRPIVIALDSDAATEARRVREQLSSDRQQIGDSAPVVLLMLPDGCEDVGDCSRDEAWSTVARAVGAASNPSISRRQTSSGVEFDVVDAIRRPLNTTGLQRIGDSVAVVYGDAGDNNTLLAIVGNDRRVRCVTSGQARMLAQLADCKRIYVDGIAARQIEKQQQLPIAADFEDLRIIAQLTCDQNLRQLTGLDAPSNGDKGSADSPRKMKSGWPVFDDFVEHAVKVRQTWDVGDPLQKLRDEDLVFVYEKIEKPIVNPTVAMIESGMLVDVPRLEQLVESTKHRADRLQNKIDQAAGCHVNVSSPKSLSKTLYEQLRLPVLQRNREGSPSTSTDTLRQLAKLHPIVRETLACRHSQAVYQQALRLRQAVRSDTGRIHGRLDPLGTETGRFICTSPNLLGVPSELREAFIAEPGHELIELDASQMELRVLAHFSQSPELLQAFQRGTDLHQLTAAHVLGLGRQPVSDAQRSIGKEVNFAIIYGQTAAGLASKLGVTKDEAQGYIDGFFRAYTRVAAWVEQTKDEARKQGLVKTLYGRRRWLPDVNSGDEGKVRHAFRQAVNTVIQGTAADIHKLAIARVFAELPNDCRMLLAVHDSMLVDVPTGKRSKLTKLIRKAMQQAPPDFTVPIEITIGYGQNWRECSPRNRATTDQVQDHHPVRAR
jgi:DNA polymerase I-like protein with 3'-5' exonuclease and polymerase domains